MKQILESSKTGILAMAIVGLAATPVVAGSPIDKTDGSWINITGTVVEPTSDEFTLDFGKGTIVVEMDSWDWYGDAYNLIDGDIVSVSGRVDNDFYHSATIEAGRVWVYGLNTYFYANPVDEEGIEHSFDFLNDSAHAGVGYTGTITEVDGREFTLDIGDNTLEVDTSSMEYNPLDDKGFQQLEVGHRVYVSGAIDTNWLVDRELDANRVITLVGDRRTGNS